MAGNGSDDVAAGAIIDLRVQYIDARFPGRLNDDQRAAVRQRLEKLADSARALSKYPLENGHEPASVFRATEKGQG